MAVFEIKFLRILDANLNRAIEGLRVVEEVARFIFEESNLQRKIKSARHAFLNLGVRTLGTAYLAKNRMNAIIRSRDTDGDVGSRGVTLAEQNRENLPSLIQSNCSRASESARVFEEFSKLLNPTLTQKWKSIRFEIYSLEKQLLALAGGASIKYRLVNMDLYCIIDKAFLGKQNALYVAREMIHGGANIIQYRDKTSCDGEFLRTSNQIRKVCADSDVIFIINDRVDIAHLSDADGVHLGQDDLPLAETRRILGQGKIIGKSCYTLRQVRTALREGVDYIAVSAIFPTETKEEARVVGPEFVSRVRKVAGDIPIAVIGGINKKNIADVLLYKPDGICIISAIQTSADIGAAVRGFVRLIKRSKR